jgi:AraC-like DNA-binding protein
LLLGTRTCHHRATQTHGGSISVQSARGFLGLAAMQGLDVPAVLAAAGAQGVLDDVDGRVPWERAERLVAEIVRRIGLGGMLRAMASFAGQGFGALYYVVRNSATVELSLCRLAEHYRVTSTLGDCALVQTGGRARLMLTQRSFLGPGFRAVVASLWAISNAIVLRQIIADDFRPLRVELESPRPADPAEVELLVRTLGSPVAFGATASTLEVPPAVLRRPVVGADPVLEAAMTRYVAELQARLPDDSTLSGRLGRLLLQTLAAGEPTLVEVARQIGSTPRTLQRRLHAEGTSFNKLLDTVRCQLALAQIEGKRASLDEVAFLLGFGKSSSFHRAFKRWTGLTPGEARKRAAAG